ncbi:MAG: domain S-box protein [Bradyrhizobium sp.]|nr:domain S-box protein [Bradyrhizobium sp.]
MELASKPNYYAFRIIGVDDDAREIVRVDRSGPDGAIRIVPDDELQREGDRVAFTETIRLPAGHGPLDTGLRTRALAKAWREPGRPSDVHLKIVNRYWFDVRLIHYRLWPPTWRAIINIKGE